jgi:hypothetical protein
MLRESSDVDILKSVIPDNVVKLILPRTSVLPGKYRITFTFFRVATAEVA